jgi:hypothetical protein
MAAPSDDEHPSGLADAAGRALFPARAAVRAWRGPLEEAVDEVLSAPEIARVVDRAFAGSLPQEFARSLVRNRVLERVAAELAASGELERMVTAALASAPMRELTDRVLASDETQPALRHVPSSPELHDAIAGQTTELAEEVAGEVRASAVRWDDRAEQVGGLRPAWLAGALAASGWLLVVAMYFVLFWSTAGQTPGIRLLRVRVCLPSRDLDRSTGRASGGAPPRDRAAVRRLHAGAVHQAPARAPGLPRGNRRRVRHADRPVA